MSYWYKGREKYGGKEVIFPPHLFFSPLSSSTPVFLFIFFLRTCFSLHFSLHTCFSLQFLPPHQLFPLYFPLFFPPHLFLSLHFLPSFLSSLLPFLHLTFVSPPFPLLFPLPPSLPSPMTSEKRSHWLLEPYDVS